MANANNASIVARETAESDCTNGWLADFISTATLEELKCFAKRVCLGTHDNFDDVCEGVVVPFNDKDEWDEAEEFRSTYMSTVWQRVVDRITTLEDEERSVF